MPEVTIQLTDDEWALLSGMAAKEFRSVNDQVRYLIAKTVKKSHQARAAADKRWGRDAEECDAYATHMRTDATHCDAYTPPSPPSSPLPPSPPSPLSSPTPPSNPPAPTPTLAPAPTPAPTCAHEGDDEIPFSAPLEPVPDDLPEVELKARASGEAQGEQSVGQEQGAARPVRAVPKPKRGVYTPAFEAWWAAYPGGGKKGEAFAEWRAAGLERDDELRERVGQALQAQVEDRARCATVGVWYPEWCDAERWLKNGRWEDKMRSTPGQLRPSAPGRPAHRGPVNQNVPDDVIVGFLKRHGGA